MEKAQKKIQQLITENEKLKNKIAILEKKGIDQPVLADPDSIELLQKISKRYIDLYDNSPDMFFSVRPNGKILSVNQTGASHLGYTKEELIGKPVWNVVFKDDIKQVKRKINDIVSNQTAKGELEFRKVRKDGGKIFVHERTSLVFDTKGKISEIRITCRDITDRKKSQNIILEQEEKYRSLTSNLNVGIYRSSAEPSGSFVEVNPAFVKMLGYRSRKQVMALKVNDLYAESSDRKKLLKGLATKGIVKNLDVKLKKKNGNIFIASLSTVVSRDENGRPIYYDGIVEDITKRKIVENAVKESEHKYRTLFDFSPSGILIEDPKGNIRDVNPAFCKMVGYSRRELIRMNVKSLCHPESIKFVEENLKKILGGEQLKHITKSKRKDGSQIYTELSETKIELTNGDPAIICISDDITDRIKAEEALIESEQNYRLLIENQTDIVVKVDKEGRLLFVSPSYCDLFGRKEEELLGKKFISLVHEQDRKQTESAMKSLYSPPHNAYLEQRALTKFGYRWIAWVDSAILDDKNKVKEIIGVGRDITERKIAEEALLKSEESYRGLFNSTTDAIYIQDKEGRFVDVNTGAVNMYGYPREFFIGKTPEFLSAPGKNNLNEVAKYLQRAFEGEPQYFEFWGLDKKGRIFPKQVKLNKGSYFGKEVIVAFAEDVTERKNAQKSLVEKEKKYRSIFNAFPDIYFKSSEEGVLKEVSPSVKTITGFNPEEIIGEDSKQFYFSEEDWKKIGNELNKKKEVKDFDTRIKTKNNGIIDCSFTAKFVIDESGAPVEIEGVVRDISHRVKAEKENRKLFRAVEQSPTIVIITDLNANIEYVNPQFTKTTGYSLEEARGQNPRILQSGNTPQDTYITLWNALTAGKEWLGEFENRKKSGEVFWESANIFPLKDEKDNITQFIAMKEDITERKKMEQELISAKEKAEESDKLKSAFLANMSHEIRTPMNAIIGFSQLLDEPGINIEERTNYINLIQNSGTDLMTLIDDIIDISKIEAGQMKIFKSQYFLDKILRELLDNYKEFLKTKPDKTKLKLNYKQRENAHKVVVYTDIDRFKQIFRNLLNNAIKFTDDGSIEFGFRINSEQPENPFLEFYIKDTGIGIPENKKKIIFESFTQANDSDTRLYGGTGLGLAITKKIVEILGGKIWLDSKVGQGSTFYFTLPYVVYKQNPDLKFPSLDQKDEHKFNWSKKKVLIVEDDDNSFTFIKSILKRTHVKITRAIDGEAALEEVQKDKFNLILMDIRIPKMDGYKATRKIRNKNKKVPIIAHTANAMEEERKKCMQAGCNDYISKPVIISDFLNLLSKYI